MKKLIFIYLLFPQFLIAQNFHDEFWNFVSENSTQEPKYEYNYDKNDKETIVTFYLGTIEPLNQTTVTMDSLKNLIAIDYLNEIYGIENKEVIYDGSFYLYRGDKVDARISAPNNDGNYSNLYRHRFLIILEWWEYNDWNPK